MFYCTVLIWSVCCVITACNASAQAIDAEVARVRESVRMVYREMHEQPELGKKEEKAQKLLMAALKKIGFTEFIPSTKAPTSVIAVLDTERPGPTVALRAEMDARRATEVPTHDPRSKIDGLMHNCGHDAHAAMLLGAADILHRNRATLKGKVVFLFQPAEETKGGADDIVDEGILEKLGVTKIFAQHAAPHLPVGTVSISTGASLAGSTTLRVTVSGDESHAAQPHAGGDVVVAAARLASGVSELPARRLDVLERPTIISIAYIHGGESDQVNLLPEKAEFAGTIRAFEDIDTKGPDGQPSIREVIERYLNGMASAFGVTCRIEFTKGPPPTVNDDDLFEQTIPILRTYSSATIDVTPHRGMFAEDFAFYTKKTPALYFGLGIAKDGLGDADVHTSEFTIHPDALDEGTKLLVLLAQIATGSSVYIK